MHIITIASRKGGVGKTTIALHMACYAEQLGNKTALIDADPQRSAFEWYESRDADSPVLVTCNREELSKTVSDAEEEGFDFCVIDTRPSFAEDIQTACELSSFVLIPTRPAIMDLRAIEPTAKILQKVGVPGAIVINFAPPRRIMEQSVTTDAIDYVKDVGIEVCPVIIHQRVDFSHSLISGEAVTEFAPKGKAAEEIKLLWEWLNE